MFDFDKIQSKKEVTGSKMVYINTTLLTVVIITMIFKEIFRIFMNFVSTVRLDLIISVFLLLP